MGLQMGVYQDRLTQSAAYGPGTRMLADWTLDASPPTFTTDEYGFGECSFTVDMEDDEAILWRDRPGAPRLTVSDGPFIAWEGRIEKIGIIATGISISALGLFREYAKNNTCSLWSSIAFDGWRAMRKDEQVLRNPDKYVFDFTNRLYMTYVQNNEYVPDDDYATLFFKQPHSSGRNLNKITFTYTAHLPSAVNVELRSGIGGNSSIFSGHLEWSVDAPAGVTVSDTVTLTLAAGTNWIWFDMYRTGSGSFTMTSATGIYYFKITSLRIQSLDAAIVLASDVVQWVVELINGSYNISTAGITTSMVDQQDMIFDDQSFLSCINAVRGRADGVSTWAFEVWESRRTYFHPVIRSDMQVAYVDSVVISHERDIDRLVTSATIVWQDQLEYHNKNHTTSNPASNTKARNRHLLGQNIVLTTSASSSAQAVSEAAPILADHTKIITAGTATFSEAFDKNGAPIPVWMIRKGWRVILRRNAIINYYEDSESIIVGHTSYNAATGEMTVEPADMPTTMEAVLARATKEPDGRIDPINPR